MEFKDEQAAVDAAMSALVAKIRAAFPVGAEVAVHEGRRVMYGVVAFEPHCERIPVRTRSGHIHHRHYSDVEVLRLPAGRKTALTR